MTSALRVAAGLAAMLVLTFGPLARAHSAVSTEAPVRVVDVVGSDRVVLESEGARVLTVQYVGVRGPVPASRLSEPAEEFHRQLVVGHRVTLEPDGPDEQGGVLLRHVMDEGGDRPLGLAVIAAGWAITAPYPPEHRYRAEFRAAQASATASSARLWGPDGLGPAEVWRLEAAEPSTYLSAHPALRSALDLALQSTTGRQHLEQLAAYGAVILVRDLPSGLAGYANPVGALVVVNRMLLTSDPAVAAVAVVHESEHVLAFVQAGRLLDQNECFRQEVRAHEASVRVWQDLHGATGMAGPRTDWERYLNALVRASQDGTLLSTIQGSPNYRAQCGQAMLRLPMDDDLHSGAGLIVPATRVAEHAVESAR